MKINIERLSLIIWGAIIFLPVFVIVFLTAGSLSGQKEIMSIPYKPITKDSSTAYEGRIETGATLSNFNQSNWTPILQLPTSIFDRKICGKILGPNRFGRIRIIFDESKPQSELVIDGHKKNRQNCIPLTNNGEVEFEVNSPRVSVAAIDEGLFFRCFFSMTKNPSVTQKCLDKFNYKIIISNNMSGSISLIYFAALVFVLGTLAVIRDNIKIAKNDIPKVLKTILNYFG